MDQKTETTVTTTTTTTATTTTAPTMAAEKTVTDHRPTIAAIVEKYGQEKSRLSDEKYQKHQCPDEQCEKLRKVLADNRGAGIAIWLACVTFIKNSPKALLAKLLGEYWVSQPNFNPNSTPGHASLKTASELNIPDDVLRHFRSEVEQKNQLLKKQEKETQKLRESYKEQLAPIQEKKIGCEKQLSTLGEQIENLQKQLSTLEAQVTNCQKEFSVVQAQEKELSSNHEKAMEELKKKHEEELAVASKSESTSEQQVETQTPTLGQ